MTESTSALDVANSALQTTTAIANATATIAPIAGQALMLGGRLGGRALLGSARLTSAATRGVANAMSSLVQAGLPVSHRGHDHLNRAGINISVQDFIHNNRM